MNDSAGPSRWPPAEPGGERGAPRNGADFAAVLGGITLDSGRRKPRWRRKADGRAEPAPAAEIPQPETPPPGEPGPPGERESPGEPETRGEAPPAHDAGPVDFDDPAALVRPYQWTGGRTRATVHLELETLVSTSEHGSDEGALTSLEHRTVAGLCRHPHAVAEVAAKLSVPLGVARVLLSDMAEQGLITIHQTVAGDDMAGHLVLMERVLSGLRRL